MIQSGDVAAWPTEARGKPVADRIGLLVDSDDRRTGEPACRPHGRRSDCDQHARPEVHELGGELRQPLGTGRPPTAG